MVSVKERGQHGRKKGKSHKSAEVKATGVFEDGETKEDGRIEESAKISGQSEIDNFQK